MKSTKRLRWVKHVILDLETSPHREFATSVSLDAVLRLAKQRLDAGEQLQRRGPADPSKHLRILDISFSDCGKFASVLFRLVDKNAPDSVYEDFTDGKVDAHPKTHTQGNRSTAHLAINLTSRVKGSALRFRAILECVPGISATQVEQRMSGLGRRCGKGSGSLDGNKTTVNYHCSFSIKPYVERTIARELEQGVLNSFVLTHALDDKTGFDELKLVKREKKKMEVKVVAADTKTKVREIWKTVQGIAIQDGYELVRAYYESAEGRPASTEINAARQDALEDLVTKVEPVDLDYDFHPKQTTVDEKFAALLFQRIA